MQRSNGLRQATNDLLKHSMLIRDCHDLAPISMDNGYTSSVVTMRFMLHSYAALDFSQCRVTLDRTKASHGKQFGSSFSRQQRFDSRGHITVFLFPILFLVRYNADGINASPNILSISPLWMVGPPFDVASKHAISCIDLRPSLDLSAKLCIVFPHRFKNSAISSAVLLLMLELAAKRRRDGE